MSDILKDIAVSELMSIKLYSISPYKTVEYANNLMKSKHFGGLPVVEENKLVGIITIKDVAKVDIGKRSKSKVKDIMTKDVVTISQEEKASTAFEKMSTLRVMRIPVVSNTGALVGMVTLTDLDRAIKTLNHRKLGEGNTLMCSNCHAPLSVTLNRTVKCEHCGYVTSF
jgi:IMP dehydrogenase